MKSANRVLAFILAILLASLLGCAGTPTKEGTGEVRRRHSSYEQS